MITVIPTNAIQISPVEGAGHRHARVVLRDQPEVRKDQVGDGLDHRRDHQRLDLALQLAARVVGEVGHTRRLRGPPRYPRLVTGTTTSGTPAFARRDMPTNDGPAPGQPTRGDHRALRQEMGSHPRPVAVPGVPDLCRAQSRGLEASEHAHCPAAASARDLTGPTRRRSRPHPPPEPGDDHRGGGAAHTPGHRLPVGARQRGDVHRGQARRGRRGAEGLGTGAGGRRAAAGRRDQVVRPFQQVAQTANLTAFAVGRYVFHADSAAREALDTLRGGPRRWSRTSRCSSHPAST